MGDRMIDVTDSAEPIVDIWPYVYQLTEDDLIQRNVYQNHLIEKVYRNERETFDHVLLPTDNPNKFIVLIVDLIAASIKGHYRLNLEKEYRELTESIHKPEDATIIWTGDLEDDCSAEWCGLLLRAEWMEGVYWWWGVYDLEDEDQIDSSNEYEEKPIGGTAAREMAEKVAKEYLGLYK
jgi:hypothetical protein